MMLVTQIYCLFIILSFVNTFTNGAVICSLKPPVPRSLDPQLCTHGVYGFFSIKENRVSLFNYTAGATDVEISNVFKLKDENPNMQLLALLWIPSNVDLKELMTNSTRYKFLTSLLGTLQAYNYDGVLVASQSYLGKANIVLDRRSGLRQLYSVLHSRNYAVVNIIPNNWEVRDRDEVVHLNDNSDLIYATLTTTWSKINMTKPQHPHALYARPEDDSSIANLNSVITRMITNGMDPKKIIVPVHFYGHSYKNVKVTQCESSVSTAETDNLKAEWRLLPQDEVCTLISKSTIYWDNDWNAPYMCKNNEVIYYENGKSLRKKLEYIINNGLGGVAVSAEDVSLKGCDSSPFWYLEVINNILLTREYNHNSRQARATGSMSLSAPSGFSWFKAILITVGVLTVAVTVFFAFKLVYLDKRPSLINQPGYRFMTKNPISESQ